jgi:hypothetical protein
MEFSFCLYLDFDDIPILHYIVPLHHLPIVDGFSPHTGIFHVFKKILVDPACQVLQCSADFHVKGCVVVSFFAGDLGIDAQNIQVGTCNDGYGDITAMYVDDVSLEICK